MGTSGITGFLLAEEEGNAFTSLPPISIKAETLFELGPLAFTNSMLYTLIVIAFLVIFSIIAMRRLSLVPRGAQNFAEAVVEFLLGLTEGTAGKRVGRRIFPLIATLFIFIITANYAGLLPGVGTVGACLEHHAAAPGSTGEEHAPAEPAEPAEASAGLPKYHCPPGPNGEEREFVPFLRAPNADLNTTLAMALLAVGVVQVAGIAAHGFGGYLKELLTPVIMAPLHIIGELSRIISLSFRLFGNIFGGEVLVTVMFALLGTLFLGFGAFIFVGLEVLFGFIQAMIFSILTLVFISTAVAGHSGGHDAGHGAGEAHTDHPGPADDLGHQVAEVVTGGQSEGSVPVKGTEPQSGTERHLGG
jgi:F-type H+-transporting ATPase subunit a